MTRRRVAQFVVFSIGSACGAAIAERVYACLHAIFDFGHAEIAGIVSLVSETDRAFHLYVKFFSC